MKFFSLSIFSFLLLSFSIHQDEHVEFVCKRKQMSTNRCHYNFKVDGAKFRYVDIGCRFKKTDDVIKKVKSGDLALAKDWEIECGGETK
ncbi:MAG TPA: hypothetical protein VFW11_01440 [Cyclobacteriaceae bacterium]|nr:hypothetical protein [Cyclobacteriaceae bacterium]